MNDNRFVDVFTLFDGSKVRFPLMTKKSNKPGPTVFLVGVIHGEEVIGIEVIHRVLDSIKLKRGIIYAIPVANMAGFSLGVRRVPYGEQTDWGNLNRLFPGDKNGGPDDKLAAAIYQTIKEVKPDLVIDLHADSQNSIPYLLLDRLVKKGDPELSRKTKKFADSFGITVCNDDTLKAYVDSGSVRTLSGALFNDKIPAFTVELGGPVVIKEVFVQAGVVGVKNILAEMDMLSDEWSQIQDKSKIAAHLHLRTETIAASEHSGKISYKVKPGDAVEKGQLLAVIENVFGEKDSEVRSTKKGWVISLGYHVLSFPGSTIATLAVEDSK